MRRIDKRWNEEEEAYLTQYFPNRPYKQIAEELNRTSKATHQHAYLLGLRKHRFPLKELDDYTRGFLEAAIDGEGTLGLYKEKTCRSKRGFTWGIRCQISNNDKGWLERIKALTGAGAIYNGSKHENPRHKPSYCLWFRVAEIRQLLPQIQLVIKAERQKIALEALPLLKHDKRSDISQKFDVRLEQLFQKQKGGMAT